MSEQSDQYPSAARAWYAVSILVLAYMLSFVDRQILTLLVAPIRHDLEVNDVAISVLQGFAFVVLYSFLGLPLGSMADRINRRNIIVAGILVWSAMTVLCGMATTYWQLFAARVGVGIGEAALAPAAYSMIVDLFPLRRRGLALGVYTASLYLGMGASIAIGGFVLSFLKTTAEITLPLFGAMRSWQAAFVLVGAPGLLVAVLALTVREPHRAPAPAAVTSLKKGFGELAGYFSTRRSLYFGQFLGFAFLVMLGLGANAWYPTFWVRVHHWSTVDAGIWLGLISMIAGTAGAVLGGYLTDQWAARGADAARLRVAIVASIVWVPILIVHVTVPDDRLAMSAMGVANFFSAMAIGLGPTAVQDVVPGRIRGQATALYFFTINLIGLGLGPTLIASVSTYLFRDDASIGSAIAVVGVPLVAAGVLLLWKAKAAFIEAKTELDRSGGRRGPALPEPGAVVRAPVFESVPRTGG